MFNAYEQHVKWVEYVKMMQALELTSQRSTSIFVRLTTSISTIWRR